MGFVDALRMRNLYPSTGIGPPDMNGGFDMLQGLIQQSDTMPAPQPFDWFADRAKRNASRRDDIQTQAIEQQFRNSNNSGMNLTGSVMNPAIAGAVRQGPAPRIITGPDTEFNRQKLGLERDKLESREGIERDKLRQSGDLATQRIGIQQQRADVYDFKAKHPNMIIKAPAGGNYTLFDPQSGEAVDSGVGTGTMTQEGFQKLLGSQRIDQINTQGTVQQGLQTTRGNQALQQIGARIQGQKDLQGSKPATALLPSQQKVNLQNVAGEIVNSSPELAEFITRNSDGTITVSPPGGYGGPSLAQYAQIQEKLYPKSNTQMGTSSYNNDNAPSAPSGWKYVPKAGGGWTAVENKGSK